MKFLVVSKCLNCMVGNQVLSNKYVFDFYFFKVVFMVWLQTIFKTTREVLILWLEKYISKCFQVLDIRDNEITVLKKAAWLNAIVSFIWTSVPFIVTLATFATYVLIDENNVLDAQKAFVTLSYMNILRMPLSK